MSHSLKIASRSGLAVAEPSSRVPTAAGGMVVPGHLESVAVQRCPVVIGAKAKCWTTGPCRVMWGPGNSKFKKRK